MSERDLLGETELRYAQKLARTARKVIDSSAMKLTYRLLEMEQALCQYEELMDYKQEILKED